MFDVKLPVAGGMMVTLTPAMGKDLGGGAVPAPVSSSVTSKSHPWLRSSPLVRKRRNSALSLRAFEAEIVEVGGAGADHLQE